MSRKKRVSPKKLYPMVGIESVDPNILEEIVQLVRDDTCIMPIRVIFYHGYYFVLEGYYEVLAANIVGKEEINIEIIDWKMQNSWLSEENISLQLKCVGMNALYDFEAIGRFQYLEYPIFYKGG